MDMRHAAQRHHCTVGRSVAGSLRDLRSDERGLGVYAAELGCRRQCRILECGIAAYCGQRQEVDASRLARNSCFRAHWRHRTADDNQQRLRLGLELAAAIQVVFDANQHDRYLANDAWLTWTQLPHHPERAAVLGFKSLIFVHLGARL